MICDFCNNKNARVMRFTASGGACDKCGDFKSKGVPDVFFNQPYLDPNLGHYKRPWEKDGVWVRSKEHKKALMKEQGLFEKGDKIHGARNFDKHISSTEKARFGLRD